ncbi:hypothetical protein Tco_0912229 [Tanacetum coccineum]
MLVLDGSTGKIFTPSTTKVDSEPPNGSNADIANQYGNSGLDPQCRMASGSVRVLTRPHLSQEVYQARMRL